MELWLWVIRGIIICTMQRLYLMDTCEVNVLSDEEKMQWCCFSFKLLLQQQMTLTISNLKNVTLKLQIPNLHPSWLAISSPYCIYMYWDQIHLDLSWHHIAPVGRYQLSTHVWCVSVLYLDKLIQISHHAMLKKVKNKSLVSPTWSNLLQSLLGSSMAPPFHQVSRKSN